MTDMTTDASTAPADGDAAVDGAEVAAGRLCVTDPGNPECARRMIAVDKLTAHPGNVRADLDLTAEFCASVAENGVRVPLLITTGADGSLRVIEGHRRLAAAAKAGLVTVPYDLDGERADDEAGQFLDMVTANSGAYRKNFTPLEEATALFAAHEAGATRTRIRKATGRKADQVKTALAVGGLGGATREQVADLDRQLTIDELALLAEFEGDPDAMEHLMRAITYRYPLEHEAERIRQDRAEAAEHERIRAELEAAGCPVTDELVPGSSLLSSLAHDGEDLTEENHRACPGHGAFFRRHDLRTAVFYCADPVANGHVSRWAQPGEDAPVPEFAQTQRTAGADGDQPPVTAGPGSAGDSPTAEPVPDPAVEQARRLVAEGNRAWAAAAEVRKRWAQQLLWRRTAPKEVIRFVAGQLLTMPDVLRRALPSAATRLMFSELAGHPVATAVADCESYPITRVPLLALAPIAVAYESEMAGDAERNSTWRTDQWAPCSRNDAGRWLQFLASLGYQLSAIEKAVADGVPWTPGEAPGPVAGEGGEPEGAEDLAGGPPGADDGPGDDSGDDPGAMAGAAAVPEEYPDPGQAVA
jgi:ParB/Sulfiredoxin domain